MLCTLNTLGRTTVFLLFFLGFQHFAGIPAQASAEQQTLVEATKLLNRSVRFVEREKTGEINELYMDPATGLIPFCMLSFESFLNIIEKRYILSIPWHDTSFDSQNQQFVMAKIKTGGGGELEPLPYKPDVHKAISPSEAEQIFSHYELQDRLHQTRIRLGADQNIPVIESTFSQAPHFTYPVETYYPMEQMKKVYSKFGLSNLLVK